MADDDSSSDESAMDHKKGEPKKTPRQLAQERLARLSKPIIRTNKRQESDDLYTKVSAGGFPALTRPENLQRSRRPTSVVKMVKLKDIQEGEDLDDLLEEAETREMFKTMATENQSHVLLDPTTSQFLRVSERAIKEMAKKNPERADKYIKEFRRVIKSRAKRGTHSQIGHISRMRKSLSRKKEQEEMMARGRRRRTPIGEVPLFASVPFSRIKSRPSIPVEEKYVRKIKPADLARLKEIQKASIDKFYLKSGNIVLDKETVKRAIKDAVSTINGTSGARRRGKTVPNPFILSESRRSRRASPSPLARTERQRRKIKGPETNQARTKRGLNKKERAAAEQRLADSLAKFYSLKKNIVGLSATPVTAPPRHKLSKSAKDAADKRRTDSLAKFYSLKKTMEGSSATPVTAPRQKLSKTAKKAADKRRTDSLAKFYSLKKTMEGSSATPVTIPPRQKLSKSAKDAADKRRIESLAKFYNLKKKMEGSSATPVTAPPRQKLSKSAKDAADKRKADSLAKFYNSKKKMEGSSATQVTAPPRHKLSKSAKDAADKRKADSLAKFYSLKKKMEGSSAIPVTALPGKKLSKSAKDAADKRRIDSLAKFYNSKKKEEKPKIKPSRQKVSESAKKRTKESVDKAIEKMMKSREPKPPMPKLKRKVFEPSASSKQRTEAAEKKAIEKRLRSLLPKEKPPKHKSKIVKPSDKSKQRVKDAEKRAIDKLKGIKATRSEPKKKRTIQPVEILDAIARKQKESYQKHLDKMNKSKAPKIPPPRKPSVNKTVDLLRKIIPAPPKFIKKPKISPTKLLGSVDKTIKKTIIPLPVLKPTKLSQRQQDSINKYINSRQDVLEKKEAARLLESKLSRWAESKMKAISKDSSMKSFPKTPKNRRIRVTDPIRSFEQRIVNRLFPPGIPREKLGLFQERVSGYVKKPRKKTGKPPGGPDDDPDDGSDSSINGPSTDRGDRGDRPDEYGRELKGLIDKRIARIQDEKALQLDRFNQIRETLKKHRGIADMHYYVPILKKISLYRNLAGFQEEGPVEDALAEAYLEDDYDEMETKFQYAEVMVITLKSAIDDLLPEIREATRCESRRAIQFIKNCRVRVQLKCASQKSSEKIDNILEKFQTFFMSQFERNSRINLKTFLSAADHIYKKILKLMLKMETMSKGRQPATNQRLDGHCGDLRDAECSFMQDLLTIPQPSDSEIESEEEPEVILPDIPLPEEVVVPTPVEEVVVVTPEEIIVVTPEDEVAVVATPDDEVAVVVTPDDEVVVVTAEEEEVFVIPEEFAVVKRRSPVRAGKRHMKRYQQNLRSIQELPDDTLLQIQYLELHDELYLFMKTIATAMAERCHSVFTEKYHPYGVGMMTITSAAIRPILLYLPKCLERVHQIEDGSITDLGLESEILERYRLETMRLKRICFERMILRTNSFLKYVYGIVISRNVMGHILSIMELKELTDDSHKATNLCREAMEKAKGFRAFFTEICMADRPKFVEKLHRVDELFREILEEMMQHVA